MSRVDLEGTLANARARLTEESGRPLARYAELTRKEARVREDQYAALSALARELSRIRPRRVERITENTLIRIAIDLLLTHADHLRGATEAELRESVTPRLRSSGTLAVRNPVTTELPANRRAGVPNPRRPRAANTGTGTDGQS